MDWFLVGAGIFAIAGAAFDWDWFMLNRRAWLFVKLLGRNGARGLYVVLGAGLIVAGVLMAVGVISPSAQ